MTDAQTRTRFRDWLRTQFQLRGFYTPSSGKYALTDFSRFMAEKGESISTLSLARYLADDNTLPSADNCRAIARALDIKPAEVLKIAGYLKESDF